MQGDNGRERGRWSRVKGQGVRVKGKGRRARGSGPRLAGLDDAEEAVFAHPDDGVRTQGGLQLGDPGAVDLDGPL